MYLDKCRCSARDCVELPWVFVWRPLAFRYWVCTAQQVFSGPAGALVMCLHSALEKLPSRYAEEQTPSLFCQLLLIPLIWWHFTSKMPNRAWSVSGTCGSHCKNKPLPKVIMFLCSASLLPSLSSTVQNRRAENPTQNLHCGRKNFVLCEK